MLLAGRLLDFVLDYYNAVFAIANDTRISLARRSISFAILLNLVITPVTQETAQIKKSTILTLTKRASKAMPPKNESYSYLNINQIGHGGDKRPPLSRFSK